MTKKASILGCGWFGLSLAKTLKKQGIEVCGSARTGARLNQISKEEIEALKIVVGEEVNEQINSFFATDCLIIAFPIHAKNKEEIDNVANWFATHRSSPQKVIFISSTSVYQSEGKVAEDSPQVTNGKGVLLVYFEKKLEQIFGKRLTIIRFAGLIGEGRNPGRFLSGKKDLLQATSSVNLLHLNDAVALSCRIIETQNCNGVFNACGDFHPDRKTFYTQASAKLGLPKPIFAKETTNTKNKIVDNNKVKQEFNFEFQYTNEAISSILA